MLSADLLTAAVWGALIIIFLEIIGILFYLRYQPPASPPSRHLPPYVRPVSPEVCPHLNYSCLIAITGRKVSV